MRQIGISEEAAKAGPETLARAGGPPFLTAATILGKIHQMAAAPENAKTVPSSAGRNARRGRAALNPEHPLMGPHPTD